MKHQTDLRSPAPRAASGNSSAASGSALIIVLGMLAVLMLMATAFSIFMRTERAGTTNLKHALSARQATYTALARVMAAIDESFGTPATNSPVPVWEFAHDNNGNLYPWQDTNGDIQTNRLPFIASSTVVNKNNSRPIQWASALIDMNDDPNVQPSAAAKALRKSNARVMTKEMSEHLTPSQIALAKNARINWMPIFSGISSGGYRPAYDAPENDAIIARYAFLAFDTTGLLDMNYGGTNLTDAIVEGTSFGSYIKSNGANNTDFADKSKIITTRKKSGGFASFAEFWHSFMRRAYNPDNDLLRASDLGLGGGGGGGGSKTYYTPDLFTSFSMSADDMDSDGRMKLPLPSDTTSSKARGIWETPNPGPTDLKLNYTSGQLDKKVAFAKLAYERFNSVLHEENQFFSAYNSKQISPPAVTNYLSGESAHLPSAPRKTLPKLTRAQLAAQSLVDYLDPDDIPDGGIFDPSGAYSYLDYPCTENVPLITEAFAEFKAVDMVEPTHLDAVMTDPDPKNWYIPYQFELNMAVIAKNPNPDNVPKDEYRIEGEVELLGLAEQLGLVFFDFFRGFYSPPAPATSTEEERYLIIKDKDDNTSVTIRESVGPAGAATLLAPIAKSRPLVPDPSYGTGKSSTFLRYRRSYEITVRVKPKTSAITWNPPDPAGPPSIPSVPANGWYKLFPDKPNVGRVDLDIRMSAKVVHDSSNTVVQQVPAPALKDLGTADEYSPNYSPSIVSYPYDCRIRVRPRLYDDSDADFNALRLFAGMGWAFCVDPRFAHNTACFRETENSLDKHNEEPIAWLSSYMMNPRSDNGKSPHWSEDIALNPAPSKILSIFYLDNSYADIRTNIATRLNTIDKNNQLIIGTQNLTHWPNSLLTQVIWPLARDNPKLSELALRRLSNGMPIYFDVAHAVELGGDSLASNPYSSAPLLAGQQFRSVIANQAMQSLSEFGNIVIGPWETLSLFGTFAPGGDKTAAGTALNTLKNASSDNAKSTAARALAKAYKPDFHRVADYFTLQQPRWPTLDDLLETFGSKGKNHGAESSAWKKLWTTEFDGEYLPGISSGKLNLNPQPIVKRIDPMNHAGRPITRKNYEPLAVMLASANPGTPVIDLDMAFEIAQNFYDNVTISSQNLFENPNPDIQSGVFRSVSAIAAPGTDFADRMWEVSPFLKKIQEEYGAEDNFSDSKREAYLGGALDQLTTRGQTFTVLLHSDAYSPKFGTDNANSGTTLATQYALVELWRDSEPRRRPDGSIFGLPADAAPPYSNAELQNITHAWHIRKIRFFNQ